MNRFAILAIALFLVSCGTEYDPYNPPSPPPPVYTPPPVTHVDEAVKVIYDEFVEECYRRGHTTCISTVERRLIESVKVVDVATLRKDPGSENRVGVCYTWTDSRGNLARAQVEILEHNGSGGKWDPDALKGLVYHELGHCLLALNHVCELVNSDGTTNTSCKYNATNPYMMFPTMYWAQVYRDYWGTMVDYMFNSAGRWLALLDDVFSDEPQGPLTKRTQE